MNRPSRSLVWTLVFTLVAGWLPLPALAAMVAPSPAELEAAKSAAAANPSDAKAHYKLGILYFASKDFANAVATWHGLLRNRQSGLALASKLKLMKAMAIASLKMGDLKAALRYISIVHARSPGDPKVDKAYTVIKAKYDEVFGTPVPVAPAPVTATPAGPAPVASVAPPKPKPTAKEAQKAFEDGEQSYEQGKIEMDTGNETYVQQFSSAINRFDIAVAGSHRVPKALFYIGAARMYRNDDAQKDLEKALTALTESQKQEPDPNTMFELGKLYDMMGDREKEIECLEKALEGNPNWAECHFLLALAYDKSSRKDAPRKTFEHAKNAIRLKEEYKQRFQEVLKNSEVAKQIAGIVSEIIEKTENDELTDEETEKYARKFFDMLGDKNVNADTFKDKNKFRELMQSDKARDFLNNTEQGQKINKMLNSSNGQRLLEKVKKKVENQ